MKGAASLKILSRLLRWLVYLAGLFAISTCGLETSCTLECSRSKVASSDMRIRFLFDDLNLQCPAAGSEGATGDYPNTVPIRFVIEKARQPLPAENRQEIGEMPLPSNEESDAAEWLPVSGLSFYPLLLQGDGAGADSGSSSSKGVLTSPDQWCTDSCGVGSIDVRPRCPGYGSQGSEFKLGICAGAALCKSMTITFNDSSSDPESEGESGSDTGTSLR